MMASEQREPLLHNFASTLTSAAQLVGSTVGSTVTAVASGETSISQGGQGNGALHKLWHGKQSLGHGRGGSVGDAFEDSLELDELRTHRPGPEDEEFVDLKDALGEQSMDLFQAAQRGILTRVKELVDSGQFRARDVDKDQCTPLHWAAINKHLDVARYLVEQGAEVDAFGGDLHATPLHWAARSGHIQIVSQLYRWGADPTLKDNQGYNALHLAAHAGHYLMAVYLLSIGMDVNAPDTMGRTALMWSSYQGNSPDMIEELIRSGAELDLTDQTGYTALHWAIIANHVDMAKKLVKAGARLDIQDPEGKTPEDWASERGSLRYYQAILTASGCSGPRTATLGRPFDMKTTNRIIYAIPFLLIAFCFQIFSILPFYFGIPIAILTIATVQTQFVIKYLMRGHRNLVTTPLMTAIPQATLLYVGLTWVKTVSSTGFLYIHHIAFMFFFSVCCYSFYKGIVTDPGYIPKAGVDARKDLVISLAEQDLLDTRTYCVTCCIRKPLRSKHCKYCDRCVVKFDHHCPWTYNCIGALNHKYFILFTASLCIGAWIFNSIVFSYLGVLESINPDYPASCTIPLPSLCAALSNDPTALFTALWAAFNSIWVLFLLVSQTWQIFRGYTTNESANWHRFRYLVEPEDWKRPPWRRRERNVFDRGGWRNCVDFWGWGRADAAVSTESPDGKNDDVRRGRERTDPSSRHAYWYTIYDIPPSASKLSNVATMEDLV